jgi:hypothetical protein
MLSILVLAAAYAGVRAAAAALQAWRAVPRSNDDLIFY